MLTTNNLVSAAENLLGCTAKDGVESIIDGYIRTGLINDPAIKAMKNVLMLQVKYLEIKTKKRENNKHGWACEKCGGSGIFKFQFEQLEEDCSKCSGTGQIRGFRCTSCNGLGLRLQLTNTVEKYIPCGQCQATGFNKAAGAEILNKILANEIEDLM
jgi:predicted SprT family Zn-dependent metalloprotease